ncbi:TroA family protein [Staphylococcus equorum]|uniref:hypothetical protein n=1 Tax=Staphylococcus equorum TaxID=246432 RepID=UPI0018663027|nr:hypothetical protein [Staphylococcus equorum]
MLYQSLNVKRPKDYPNGVNKTGYAKIQNEDIPHYAGDYIHLTNSNVGSIEKSNLWKNMPAYKQNRIIKVDNGIYWFNDPYSLNYQMKDLTTKFKNKGDQA